MYGKEINNIKKSWNKKYTTIEFIVGRYLTTCVKYCTKFDYAYVSIII